MDSIRRCSIDECDRRHSGKGLCAFHYARKMRGTPLDQPIRKITWDTPTTEERFWTKVQPTGFCWEWTGAKDTAGYGMFDIGDSTKDRAHRIAYRWLVGDIAEGLHLDHLCRNRGCCNPDHLEPVTPGENALRGYSPGMIAHRAGTCRRGHSMGDAYVRPDTGKRMCRTCIQDRQQAKKARPDYRKTCPHCGSTYVNLKRHVSDRHYVATGDRKW